MPDDDAPPRLPPAFRWRDPPARHPELVDTGALAAIIVAVLIIVAVGMLR
jgi:hypothetical protein